ncbi:hypothetical protein ACFV27_00595 [Streptomyces antimycoticus]|uniref:hypothetical protein n=1 Tax=Streptomyces antimycoticus TaxID=68175 RepID=UPI00368A81DC
MTAVLLDVLVGVGGAGLGVVTPAVLAGAIERALPLFLSFSVVDRAEATIAAPVYPEVRDD